MKWQPIETAPLAVDVLLYYPISMIGRISTPPRQKVDKCPVLAGNPTHWMQLPDPPTD